MDPQNVFVEGVTRLPKVEGIVTSCDVWCGRSLNIRGKPSYYLWGKPTKSDHHRKGSSWSWTQTWWAWWPWWAIVFFLEPIFLFNKHTHGIDAFRTSTFLDLQKKWLRMLLLEHNDIDPCENHFKHWNTSMQFSLPNVIWNLSNGVFVATVAAEQFRYRCLYLGILRLTSVVDKITSPQRGVGVQEVEEKQVQKKCQVLSKMEGFFSVYFWQVGVGALILYGFVWFGWHVFPLIFPKIDVRINHPWLFVGSRNWPSLSPWIWGERFEPNPFKCLC